MSLEAHWHSTAAGTLWDRLKRRLQTLESPSDLRVVRRNLDCECNCDGIDPEVWTEFLREMATALDPAVHDPGTWCDLVDAVLARRRRYYFLPGRTITSDVPDRLFTYMRLGRFVRHYLTDVPITPDLPAHLIEKGRINGTHLELKRFGGELTPCWISGDPLFDADADSIRDILGLGHLDCPGETLLEVSYPARLIASGLHAPTVIDAAWNGCAGNCYFVKRRGTRNNGPDWGHTLDMSEPHQRRAEEKLFMRVSRWNKVMGTKFHSASWARLRSLFAPSPLIICWRSNHGDTYRQPVSPLKCAFTWDYRERTLNDMVE